MDELALTNELGANIVGWMKNRYAPTTQKQRRIYLKSIFAKHPVLNQKTLRVIMKEVKYQHQRAGLAMINAYCYDNNIDFNLRIPKVIKQGQKMPTILSPAEIELIIKSAPKPYDLTIRCIFNIGAGLRVSEIIKFKWDDIRWIDWLKNQENYGVAFIKEAKGDTARAINIPKKLMKDLYEYAKETMVLNEFRIPVGGSIFPFGEFTTKATKMLCDFDPKDKRLHAEVVKIKYDWFRYHILRRHCEKALGKRFTVHSLRHSRATYLHTYENTPIEDLQLLLGHKSLNTTMIYTRVMPRNVFEKLKETKEV